MLSTLVISSQVYKNHKTGRGHPESPDRCYAIEQSLHDSGFITNKTHLTPRRAEIDEILLCHTKSYVDLVEKEVAVCLQEQGKHGLRFLSTGDAVICPDSYEVALYAAGGVITACDKVMTREFKNAFSIVRPPGHHATQDRGMGFCIFNNVAIGARYIQKKHDIKRVLIIDWDVHHGNGTQDIFNSDPSVFYFSTHQSNIYPGTGLEEDVGEGEAKYTKLNCPIDVGPDSRKKVFEAFTKKLVPAMEKFQPEVVMISCGFDAHELDPLGALLLTDKDFFELTEIVKAIAHKYSKDRLISVLEGGYNLKALASASKQHLTSLAS